MNIFQYLQRPIRKQVFDDHIDLFASFIKENGDIIEVKILTQRRMLTSSSDSMVRVLNGSSRSCGVRAIMNRSRLRWASNGNDLELLDNEGSIAAFVERREIERLGLSRETTTDLIIEIGSIFKEISRTGRMPSNYNLERSGMESERPIDTDEAIPKPKKELNLVDDIPEDVFTMESIIDRIRNCGAVADAKHVPVIIRFGEQKLMITDTSIEDNFLYLDVVEVPKKELPKGSMKFSDFLDAGYYNFNGNTISGLGDSITMEDIRGWSTIGQTTINSATASAAGSAVASNVAASVF